MNSGVPLVNRDKTGKMLVDTPESGQTVCLIFGRDSQLFYIYTCCVITVHELEQTYLYNLYKERSLLRIFDEVIPIKVSHDSKEQVLNSREINKNKSLENGFKI